MSKAGYMNLGGVTLVGNATVTAATDLLTIAGHGLADGDLVTVDTGVGGGAELRADTEYVVRNPTTDTFQLSAPAGAAPFNFAADGTCNVYLGVPSYSAVELRRLNAIHLHPGSADRLGAREGVRPHSTDPVTVAATTYTVAEGLAVVYPRETSTSAPYTVEYASESASLNPADGTNPRLDGIDLQVQDDDEDGLGQRRPRIVYVPGTPASEPTAPTVTDNSLRLATILVPQTGGGDPEVDSLAQYATGPAILPIRDATERPTTGLFNGLMCWRQDTEQLEVWYDSVWHVLVRERPLPIVNRSGSNIIDFTNTSPSPGSPIVGTSFVAPPSGCVYVTVYASINAESTNQVSLAPFVATGGTVGSGTLVYNPLGGDDTSFGVFSVSGGVGLKGGIRAAVTGLTAGNTYNAFAQHWLVSGIGNIFWRELILEYHD